MGDYALRLDKLNIFVLAGRVRCGTDAEVMLCFAKTAAGPFWGVRGARLGADSPHAKSNRRPGTKAPDPPFAGRICLQHLLKMVGTETIPAPLVFFRLGSWCTEGRRASQAVRQGLEAACEAAEKPDALFHNFPRTAVRNMIRAGVDR